MDNENMSMNLAEKFAERLDQKFYLNSLTEAFVNRDYKFDGVKTVTVSTPVTAPLVDYNRIGTGDRYGGNIEADYTNKPYTITKDKSFKRVFDKGNTLQALYNSVGKWTDEQIKQEVTPVIDMDRFATGFAGATAASQTITYNPSTLLNDIMGLRKFLTNAKAPLSDRVLFASASIVTNLIPQINTQVTAVTKNDGLLKDAVLGKLYGMTVVEVPDDMLPDTCEALIWHRSALLGVKQLNELRTKGDLETMSGTAVMGRYIFDSFVLDAKKNGVAALVSA